MKVQVKLMPTGCFPSNIYHMSDSLSFLKKKFLNTGSSFILQYLQRVK